MQRWQNCFRFWLLICVGIIFWYGCDQIVPWISPENLWFSLSNFWWNFIGDEFSFNFILFAMKFHILFSLRTGERKICFVREYSPKNGSKYKGKSHLNSWTSVFLLYCMLESHVKSQSDFLGLLLFGFQCWCSHPSPPRPASNSLSQPSDEKFRGKIQVIDGRLIRFCKHCDKQAHLRPLPNQEISPI